MILLDLTKSSEVRKAGDRSKYILNVGKLCTYFGKSGYKNFLPNNGSWFQRMENLDFLKNKNGPNT